MGVTMLSAYVAGCIQIIMYNSSTANYEPRAWTRLERVMGYTYCACPLFKYLDDDYPKKPMNIPAIMSKQESTFQLNQKTRGLELRIRDPAGADCQVTNPADLDPVKKLCATVANAQPLNPARTWNNIDKLVFDQSLIPLDMEHYGLDVEKESAKRNKSSVQATNKQNDDGILFAQHISQPLPKLAFHRARRQLGVTGGSVGNACATLHTSNKGSTATKQTKN